MNILFYLSLSAFAQEVADSHDLYPISADDVQDQLTTYRAQLQEAGTGGVGALLEYDYQVLDLYHQVGRRVTGTGLIQDLWTVNLSGHYNLSEDVSLQVGLPLWIAGDVNSPAFGDLKLSAPLYLGTISDVGLSVVPMVTVPTGSGSPFLSQDNWTGGGVLALSRDSAQWSLAGNLGYQFQPKSDYLNLNGDDRLISSFGAGYLLEDDLSLHGELSYRPTLSPADVVRTEEPVEAMVYLRDTNVVAGLSTALTRGVGAPTYRAFVGLSGVFGKAHCPECPACESVVITPTPPEEWTLELQPIYFDFDKDNIRPEYQDYLQKLAAQVSKFDVKLLIVTGTDVRGTDQYNVDLSRRRAESVVSFLVSAGVSSDSLTYRYEGEKELKVQDCKTEECHQQNRYAEFIRE